VFVSSHLLGEIEQTCDAVAILRRGRCIASGPVAEVIGLADAGLLVEVDDLRAAARVLAGDGITVELRSGELRVGLPGDQAARVTRLLAAHDLWVTGMRPDHASLEERFFELTEQPAPAQLQEVA
jgi:ABC-2 type transport system ATP-binding protein